MKSNKENKNGDNQSNPSNRRTNKTTISSSTAIYPTKQPVALIQAITVHSNDTEEENIPMTHGSIEQKNDDLHT